MLRRVQDLKRLGRDLQLFVERSLLALMWRAGRRRGQLVDATVLIAPPGRGNIGDQALVEAFVENVSGVVVLLAESDDSFDVPHRYLGKLHVVAAPGLLYGDTRAHLRACKRLIDQGLASARHVAVVGADIMDGLYNPRASSRRFSIATCATQRSKTSRILGFSWGDRALGGATSSARRAARAGVSLLVRDPVSARRLREARVPGVTEVADMVFAAWTPDLVPGSGPGTPVAVVNVSGLIAKSDDLSMAYVRALRPLLHAGWRVHILPHVSRPGNDDVEQGDRLFETLKTSVSCAESQVSATPCLVTPSRVREIVRQSDLVITGRMHLAVMALSEGTAVVTLATQGKVEGLMRLFELSEYCIEPRHAGEQLPAAVSHAVASRSSLLSRINENRPRVKSLSMRNFEGL